MKQAGSLLALDLGWQMPMVRRLLIPKHLSMARRLLIPKRKEKGLLMGIRFPKERRLGKSMLRGLHSQMVREMPRVRMTG